MKFSFFKTNRSAFFFIFLFFIINFPICALQAYQSSLIDEQVLKGLDYCYHFKWNSAEDLFKKIIQQNPENPKGYHYLSSVYFWYYLSSKNEQDYNSFLKYSDQAIEKASDMLDENSSAAILYIIGSNYNYRTVAFAKEGDYTGAIWAAKKSESYLSDCLEKDSSYYDAYLGLGLYNFAMSKIPSGFKWALNLAGISGNEHKGIRYIRITADKGNFAKTEAQYYLSQILSETAFDFISSARLLSKLTSKYPENILFSYSSAVVDLKQRNPDEAELKLSAIVKRNDNKFIQVISFSNFLLGDVFYRRNNFEEAKKYYRIFLDSTPDKDYTGIASYRLAVCYEITGDRETAVKFFKRTSGGNMDIEDDIFANRCGARYIKRKLTENEIETIKTGNLLESGKYSEAETKLQGLLNSLKGETLKSILYLNLSEAAFNLEKYDISYRQALNAEKLSSEEEGWVKPYACFYAGRALQKLNRKEEAVKYFDKADDNNNYDYQKKLEAMIDFFRKPY